MRRLAAGGVALLVLTSFACTSSSPKRKPSADQSVPYVEKKENISYAQGKPVRTNFAWDYVYVPTSDGQKVGYWQNVMEETSVFLIKDSEIRKAEIRKRQEQVDREEGNNNGCPVGMARVAGRMNDWVKIEALQNSACKDDKWDSKFYCQKFDKDKLSFVRDVDLEKKDAKNVVKTAPMDYCMDRFEYPNIPFEFPGVLISYTDAEKICKAEGKRMCTENEWVFACEGEESLPYPYGYERQVQPGVVGCHTGVMPKQAALDSKTFFPKNGERAVKVIDALWMGVPSGTFSTCRSPFGIYDLTGNVDEWTSHEEKSPFKERPVEWSRFHPGKIVSKMKGGWWAPVRARCQPATVSHDVFFADYQQGFRCCADAPAK